VSHLAITPRERAVQVDRQHDRCYDDIVVMITTMVVDDRRE